MRSPRSAPARRGTTVFSSLVAVSWLVAQAAAAPAEWRVLSREEGCVPVDVIVRAERLSRAPATPEDFADLMRARGHRVQTGLPDGFPPEMRGSVVMVRYGDHRAPIFVRAELCAGLSAR